ncbi:O-antigen/teichoic acid export membrane protein [Rhodobium orientis]|uniref:Uncharacterized protein n=1 Tax=Rhodobium orientis TaxID=34017 RepID=A0A327JJ94_9HYPH|nr:lipopolysaccharide biosynthesis protein [Rhodobium orientis]MBB4303593.1 O-antigen/teichoic acid export membrane protein [Rhodobium orientis]MBK5951951.1 hypothetical protein [Rhodobium orientis]RAI24872.1 hypothetical protein CH339_20815 [Rhodobium orientis]
MRIKTGLGLLPPRLSRRAAPLVARLEDILQGTDEHASAQRMAAIAFAIRIVGAAIAYGSQILLARFLGGFEYGVFVVVWTWVTILGSMVHLGFATSVIRLIPEYEQTARLDDLRGIILGSRLVSLVASTAIAGMGALGVFALGDLVASHYVLPIYLALVCLPLFTLTEVQEGICRAYSWTDLALSPIYIWRPMLILAVVLGMDAAGVPLDAANVCLAAIGATYVSAVIQWLRLDRRLAGVVAAGARRFALGDWLRISLPILLVDGFFVLLTGTDVVILGQFRSPDEVAVYFAATKTLALVHFVYYAVRAGAAHRYSKFFHSGDHDGLARFVADSVKWTFWPSLAFALLLVVFGELVLSLFGAGFAAGYPSLVILTAGVVARAALGPVESLLTMAGHQNAAAAVYGGTFAANLMLCLLLIPAYGAEGAAAAMSLALIGESLALYSVTRRKLGLNVFVFARPKPAPAAE